MKIGGLVIGMLLLVGGCGAGSGNQLSGSVKESYGGLSFDRVDILRQDSPPGTPYAFHVIYLETKTNYYQVHVVVKAPVVEGQQKDLVKDGAGSVSRVVNPPSEFPEMKIGNILFDRLGAIGEPASGSFHITFQNAPSAGQNVEGTLSGDFSGTLAQQ